MKNLREPLEQETADFRLSPLLDGREGEDMEERLTFYHKPDRMEL